MISDEAVEAAAEAINKFAAKYVGVLDPVPLQDMSGLDREYALGEARAALEAAAPYMPSDLEVFVRMFEGCAENCRANNSGNDPHVEGQADAFTFAARQLRVALTNPYRSQV